MCGQLLLLVIDSMCCSIQDSNIRCKGNVVRRVRDASRQPTSSRFVVVVALVGGSVHSSITKRTSWQGDGLQWRTLAADSAAKAQNRTTI
jgi:hypothetical protein